MKRVFTLLAFLFISLSFINAQGIYQFWGTTANGGSNNTGVLFSTDTTGNFFTSRHQFNSYNPGANPYYSELIEYNGKFYGMTLSGGSNGLGVIFEWNPVSNIYTKMIDLNAANGSKPYGSLSLYAGKFYGMTLSGGINDLGVIFEWDPATNVYTKKIDLTSADGCNPYGNLTLHGSKFYGMTNLGGSNNTGVIFEWDPILNLYTKKIELNTAIGKSPFGNLTYFNGKFYGMTSNGGASNYGVIFEWEPVTNQYIKKWDFGVTQAGYNPRWSFTILNGKFYGITRKNPADSKGGVIFEWDPVFNLYTTKFIFPNATSVGTNPVGNLAISNGKLYGMTNGHSQGIDPIIYGSGIFEFDPVTNIYAFKISMNEPDSGYSPLGSLVKLGEKFYGMTNSGGSNHSGVIFEWDPNINLYSKKIDFNGNNGFNPSGALSLFGGRFYGVAKTGGWSGRGILYEWDPSTDTIQNKIQLWAITGGIPYGNLIIKDDKFYGMTNSYGYGFGIGGGVIFEWDPTLNNYSKKIGFSDYSGGHPYGSLTLNDGKFYGMTFVGGITGTGYIFEWDPVTNIYSKKIDLNSSTGNSPYGSLTLHDGKFYGLTYAGGINNAGVIFEWDPVTNIYSKKIDLNSTTGSNPYGSLNIK
jgi:uncharacterized repeat protein (TIGR03803 family)